MMEVPVDAVMRPKVEAEVALVLERDLDCARPTLADVISAVAYALPAIEIVGSRIANWDIELVDTIADNSSSSGFVVGAWHRPGWLTDTIHRSIDRRPKPPGERASCKSISAW